MENEEAKAAQELAKFGAKALDTSEKLGGFLSRVFGTLTSDVVGVIGGDWLHHVRIRNAAKLAQRTEAILRERGILDATEPMSPSVALPILSAAQDETRESLCELWARMLANGMDPRRRNTVRQSIINIVKNLEPLDAVLLHKAFELSPNGGKSADFPDLQLELNASPDEFELSIENLRNLRCINETSHTLRDGVYVTTGLTFTSLGREVQRATSLY